jgi:hypothetical protein
MQTQVLIIAMEYTKKEDKTTANIRFGIIGA